MAMEIMRRRREKAGLQRQIQTHDVNGNGDTNGLGLDIIGGIMLFPTVVDIAKSPNGRILTVCLPVHLEHRDDANCDCGRNYCIFQVYLS